VRAREHACSHIDRLATRHAPKKTVQAFMQVLARMHTDTDMHYDMCAGRADEQAGMQSYRACYNTCKALD
jgi:hypothetical protein